MRKGNEQLKERDYSRSYRHFGLALTACHSTILLHTHVMKNAKAKGEKEQQMLLLLTLAWMFLIKKKKKDPGG